MELISYFFCVCVFVGLEPEQSQHGSRLGVRLRLISAAALDEHDRGQIFGHALMGRHHPRKEKGDRQCHRPSQELQYIIKQSSSANPSLQRYSFIYARESAAYVRVV